MTRRPWRPSWAYDRLPSNSLILTTQEHGSSFFALVFDSKDTNLKNLSSHYCTLQVRARNYRLETLFFRCWKDKFFGKIENEQDPKCFRTYFIELKIVVSDKYLVQINTKWGKQSSLLPSARKICNSKFEMRIRQDLDKKVPKHDVVPSTMWVGLFSMLLWLCFSNWIVGGVFGQHQRPKSLVTERVSEWVS